MSRIALSELESKLVTIFTQYFQSGVNRET